MAYRGTGTDVDPYIVTTFADFLTCVGDVGSGAGAYVKIANDLDAAAEGYEYIDPITVEAASVYADETVSIKNVTIVGTNLLKCGSSSTAHSIYFTKIHFENWTLKLPSNGNAKCFALARNYNNMSYFEDCELNIEVQGYNGTVVFSDNTNFYHCSAYAVFYNAASAWIEDSTTTSISYTKSNFYFKFIYVCVLSKR